MGHTHNTGFPKWFILQFPACEILTTSQGWAPATLRGALLFQGSEAAQLWLTTVTHPITIYLPH